MLEIRFHGRGGQGAVTAAEILAVAVAMDGKRSQSFPVFGVERRGSPVTAFCRIDDKPIAVHQKVYNPDIVVVLDQTLVEAVNVCEGLSSNGTVIINTTKGKNDFKLPAKNLFVIDATNIARRNTGTVIVNTAMLGALAKAANTVSLESLKKAVDIRFNPRIAEGNKKAVEECYNSVK